VRHLLARLLVLSVLALPAAAQTNAIWFPVGEETYYDIYWGMLPVGQTHVITGWTNHQGRTVLSIRYFTRTNKVVEQLYPVNINMQTLIDPDTFLPIRFTEKAMEGRKRTDDLTVFDYAAGTATVTSRVRNRTTVVPIGPDTRDLIALMYYLRRAPFVSGTTLTNRVFADGKVYDLALRVGAREKVPLDDYGKVDCVHIDPEAAFNGLFVRKGKLEIWVSADARQLCTKILGEVPVASIRIVLSAVKGPGTDRWVKPAQKGN
jgi:hypothetical protein